MKFTSRDGVGGQGVTGDWLMTTSTVTNYSLTSTVTGTVPVKPIARALV